MKLKIGKKYLIEAYDSKGTGAIGIYEGSYFNSVMGKRYYKFKVSTGVYLTVTIECVKGAI